MRTATVEQRLLSARATPRAIGDISGASSGRLCDTLEHSTGGPHLSRPVSHNYER